MTVVNFTKKQNVLTGGSAIFGEAKSTDSRAMGVDQASAGRPAGPSHHSNLESEIDADSNVHPKMSSRGFEPPTLQNIVNSMGG